MSDYCMKNSYRWRGKLHIFLLVGSHAYLKAWLGLAGWYWVRLVRILCNCISDQICWFPINISTLQSFSCLLSRCAVHALYWDGHGGIVRQCSFLFVELFLFLTSRYIIQRCHLTIALCLFLPACTCTAPIWSLLYGKWPETGTAGLFNQQEPRCLSCQFATASFVQSTESLSFHTDDQIVSGEMGNSISCTAPQPETSCVRAKAVRSGESSTPQKCMDHYVSNIWWCSYGALVGDPSNLSHLLSVCKTGQTWGHQPCCRWTTDVDGELAVEAQGFWAAP